MKQRMPWLPFDPPRSRWDWVLFAVVLALAAWVLIGAALTSGCSTAPDGFQSVPVKLQ